MSSLKPEIYSAFAAVENLELVAGVGREEARHVAQPLGQRGRSQQRILALAQIVVIEVDGQRQHVDGQRIGERRLEESVARALVDSLLAGARVLRAAARLPRILAGFAAHLRLGLRPDQRRKALGNARGFNKVVRHVDEELEGQPEAIFYQPRGKKDGLRRAEDRIAMADGAIAQVDGVRRARSWSRRCRRWPAEQSNRRAARSAADSVAGTAPTRRSRSASEMRVSPHAA